MKIMATFDGSVHSESILPQLGVLAALPDAEFLLVRVAPIPEGLRAAAASPFVANAAMHQGGGSVVLRRLEGRIVETKEQAVESTIAEVRDYLDDIAARLPAGTPHTVHPLLDDQPATAIVKLAMTEQPDLIVMATHGRTGLVHVLFGDTAEKVVEAAVAPVLLVHPDCVKRSRR
jgi:nucleotide-binding universal stress UspA family protein